MIAVVTGSTGFIGSHLVDALRAKGAEVRALRRPGSLAPVGRADVSTSVVDLSDRAAVARCPAWDGATHCFHLGGATKARTHAVFMASNVVPTRAIAEAIAARGADGPQLIFVSSQAAAGPAINPESPRRENDPALPIEGYGASKLAAEQAISTISTINEDTLGGAGAAPLRATVIRAASVYGPRDRDFLQAFRQATRHVAFYAAPADQQFSIVHVRDLVAALLAAAANTNAVGRTYFVANAAPVSWRELYRAVAQMAGSQPLEIQLPAPVLRAAAFLSDLWPLHGESAPLLTSQKAALSRPRWWLCDSSRARTELGWTPTMSLEAGLRDTFDWYRAAGWLRGDLTRIAVAA